ncbi:MAG: Gfo/Idh/MocA family oxidoreductase [Bryobacterales bacterium]|nr:Gfo/Idh/MocA family oxidoreductase [Bryobacterales bacterium]
MTKDSTRRFFVGAAAAAAASRVCGANDRINVGIVGVGGRGGDHLSVYSQLPGARVVGVCDVSQAARERAQAMLLKNTGEKAREFEDMREVYADSKVDAVSIATPNHWHALAAIWAMKAGKDVYAEKPASYDIAEGLKMVEVARDSKRMLQIGSQHRSNPFKIRGMAALRGGVIGDIYHVRGLCFKRRRSIGSKPDTPVPPGVNWDLFRGPAPMRPFNELRFKYNWHWFWDTGNGEIGNTGVHEMGIARWAMGDPEWPKAVHSHGGKFVYKDDQETPNTMTSSFDFGDRELVFEIRGLPTGAEAVVSKTKGGWRPSPSATSPQAGAPPLNVMIGNIFLGSEGWAAMSDEGFQAFKGDSDELVMQEYPDKKRENDPTSLHIQNFLSVCRSRNDKDLHDGIGIANMSAAMCHLANISYRVGRGLKLQAGPKFVNDPAATQLLSRTYRKPYML